MGSWGSGSAGRLSGSWLALGGVLLILLAGTYLEAAPWATFHAFVLGIIAFLLVSVRPQVAVPKSWIRLALLFAFAGMATFLPARWFFTPEWRHRLEALGVATGPLVAIQWRMAAEGFALVVITLLTGLWLTGFRATSRQLGVLAVAFLIGVAAYALVSAIKLEFTVRGPAQSEPHFGFFPNRNHTATFLVMGTVCGAGVILQALRDKRHAILGIGIASTSVCVGALIGYSISRAGPVLLVAGTTAWLVLVRPRHFGWRGIAGLAIWTLVAASLFFTTESRVRQRVVETTRSAGILLGFGGQQSDPCDPAVEQLDLRIPIALDTLNLIGDFKWTGVGTGQFHYVFPQYRVRASVENHSDSFHPESDWLWLAAESGIPATLAIAALVIAALGKSATGLRRGRKRALRSACLVAACVVPFHGLFDVPGHRLTLALGAVFLYVLSLDPEDVRPVRTRRTTGLASILGGICLMAAAVALHGTPGGFRFHPATTLASAAIDEARRLVAKDRELQKQADSQGVAYSPPLRQDPLETAARRLRNVRTVMPLEREVLRLESWLACNYDDNLPWIDHLFSLEQALDPNWVGAPLQQANLMTEIDSHRSARLWQIALERAARVDRIRPGTHWSRTQTLRIIRNFAIGKPGLEPFLPKE